MLDTTQTIHRRPPASALRELLQSEAGGGIVLMVAAAAALAIANSPLAPAYFGVLKTYVAGLSILHWINDALMAVFFLLVGLEIKREFLDGQLSTWPRRILPGVAAAGGMAAPALIYVALNVSNARDPARLGDPDRHRHRLRARRARAAGLARAGLAQGVPDRARHHRRPRGGSDHRRVLHGGLGAALARPCGLVLLVLAALNRAGIERLAPYLALGAVLWFFVLKSGVHATLAGVALALTIPLRPSPGRPDDPASPLHILEHALHPWVAFLIVPVFGFANAGVSLAGMSWAALLAPVPLGIAAGLFIGKQIGVFLTTWVAVKLDWADCPEDASLAQVYGVSLLCGIGFTMSLFIGLLAFPTSPELQDAVKIGVLSGSVLSAVVGALVLAFAPCERPQRTIMQKL